MAVGLSCLSEHRMTLNSNQRQQVLDKVRDLVLTRHINAIDPDQDYSRWNAELQNRRPQILCSSEGDFEQQLQSLLAGLQSSHTTFFHGSGSAVPAQYAINATLIKVESPDGDVRWMFCDVVED